MATATSDKAATGEKAVKYPAALTIEVDAPRNRNPISNVLHIRLRSAMDVSKPVVANAGTPRAPAMNGQWAGLPKLPGMQMTLDPKTRKWLIHDPLTDKRNEALCEQAGRVMRSALCWGEGPLRGVPDQEGTLDAHKAKTLLKEMRDLVESEYAKVTKGKLPTDEDLDRMPGHLLYDPAAITRVAGPEFKKDFADWYERIMSLR